MSLFLPTRLLGYRPRPCLSKGPFGMAGPISATDPANGADRRGTTGRAHISLADMVADPHAMLDAPPWLRTNDHERLTYFTRGSFMRGEMQHKAYLGALTPLLHKPPPPTPPQTFGFDLSRLSKAPYTPKCLKTSQKWHLKCSHIFPLIFLIFPQFSLFFAISLYFLCLGFRENTHPLDPKSCPYFSFTIVSVSTNFGIKRSFL